MGQRAWQVSSALNVACSRNAKGIADKPRTAITGAVLCRTARPQALSWLCLRATNCLAVSTATAASRQ